MVMRRCNDSFLVAPGLLCNMCTLYSCYSWLFFLLSGHGLRSPAMILEALNFSVYRIFFFTFLSVHFTLFFLYNISQPLHIRVSCNRWSRYLHICVCVGYNIGVAIPLYTHIYSCVCDLNIAYNGIAAAANFKQAK